MRDQYGFKINLDRNYGYCHTSAEAVQLMNFMKGSYTPDLDIWELIARGKDYKEMANMPLNKSDLFIVEISSLKCLTLGDNYIQLNYLANAFRGFFSCKIRTKSFWKLTAQDDIASLDLFLSENWASTPQQVEESNTLRRIKRSLMTESEIRRDIKELMANLDNVLFVTHVDAKKPDGNTIASRSSLISLVNKIVNEEGGNVYNPTSRMLEVGQEFAIEDHSDSLAHYTESFCEILFKDWYKYFISICFDKLSLTGKDTFLNKGIQHYQSLIDIGSITGLLQRLESLMVNHGKEPKLFELIAKVSSMSGSDKENLNTLEQSLEYQPENITLLTQYVEVLIRLEYYIEAGKAVNRINSLGQTIPVEELYTLGTALYSNGDNVQAFSLFESVLLKNSNHVMAATKIADLLLLKERSLSAVNLDEELRQKLINLLSPALLFKLNLLDINFSEAQERKKLISKYRESELLDIVPEMVGKGYRTEASLLLFEYQTNQYGSLASLELVSQKLFEIALSWLEEYEKEETIEKRYELINCTLIAFPILRETRISFRKFEQDLLFAIREMYKATNIEGLKSLSHFFQSTDKNVYELEFLTARLLFNEQNYADAMKSALRAVEYNSDSLLANVLLMRSSFRNNELLIAKKAAEAVCLFNDTDSEKLYAEAILTLERIPKKSWVLARDKVDLFEKHSLLQLAKEDSSYFEQCQVQEVRLVKLLIAELVTKEKNKDADLIDYALKVSEIVPDDKKVMLIIGRNLVKKGVYSKAKSYWSKLIELEPNNESYQFQLNRCIERMS
jgi:Flp pilus assembly protein TadD